MDVLDIVGGTADAAFWVDRKRRIGGWNAAAVQLLGFEEAARGKPCHQVIRGVDVFGNRYCGGDCPVQRMARRHEPIHRFELRVQTSHCEGIRLCMSIIVLPGADRSEFDIVHLLCPVPGRSGNPRRVAGSPPTEGVPSDRSAVGRLPSANARLTRRELEVLGLLASGMGTVEIADLLSISWRTARNHIQNILGKLGAHSRLEAVSIARRRTLI